MNKDFLDLQHWVDAQILRVLYILTMSFSVCCVHVGYFFVMGESSPLWRRDGFPRMHGRRQHSFGYLLRRVAPPPSSWGVRDGWCKWLRKGRVCETAHGKRLKALSEGTRFRNQVPIDEIDRRLLFAVVGNVNYVTTCESRRKSKRSKQDKASRNAYSDSIAITARKAHENQTKYATRN